MFWYVFVWEAINQYKNYVYQVNLVSAEDYGKAEKKLIEISGWSESEWYSYAHVVECLRFDEYPFDVLNNTYIQQK